MRGDSAGDSAARGAQYGGSLSGPQLKELASEISIQGGERVARIVLVHDAKRSLSEYSFIGESGEVLRRLQVPRASTPEGSRPWTGAAGSIRPRGSDSLARLIARGTAGI